MLQPLHIPTLPPPADARVLIVGAGGLGCPAALALAASGVGVGKGAIGIADGDTVDVSNLHRQVLHRASAIGHAKVESARDRLRRIGPDIHVETYAERLSAPRLAELLGAYDVVLDATDTPETKDAINAAAVRAGIPLVHAGVVGLGGQVLAIVPGATACLACAFAPDGERNESDPAPCSAEGVLGAVAGVVGSLQASETLRLLDSGSEIRLGRLIVYDAFGHGLRSVDVPRSPECTVCATPAAESGTSVSFSRRAQGAAHAIQ